MMQTIITHGLAAIGGGTVIYAFLRHVSGWVTSWEATMAADIASLKSAVFGQHKAPVPPPAPATPPPAAALAQ